MITIEEPIADHHDHWPHHGHHHRDQHHRDHHHGHAHHDDRHHAHGVLHALWATAFVAVSVGVSAWSVRFALDSIRG